MDMKLLCIIIHIMDIIYQGSSFESLKKCNNVYQFVINNYACQGSQGSQGFSDTLDAS